MTEPRFNIEEIPLVNLYVATDKQNRLRLSADIVELYQLNAGNRVALGYDSAAEAIALRVVTNNADPTSAAVDKRGYIASVHFFRKTKLVGGKRYVFVAEQDGWLVFTAQEDA